MSTDEIDNPRVPPRKPHVAVARHPGQLLLGLALGIVVAFFVGVLYRPAAPAVPFLVGTALRITERPGRYPCDFK
jgi:hypothetical protein